MEKIDIAMTATLRPTIIEQTFISIVRNICEPNPEYEFNLVINVDPAGEKVSQSSIVDIAKKYFANVISNVPEKPSFPMAVKWVWSNTSTKYVLHSEDDFEIMKEIDMDHIVRILQKHPKIGSLRLCRGIGIDSPAPDMNGKIIRRMGQKWHYNDDGFYLASMVQGGVSLNAAFMRGNFQRKAATFLEKDIDPEAQIAFSLLIQRVYRKHPEKKRALYKFLSEWNFAIYALPLAVRDIGRTWRRQHGFHKPRTKGALPTTWVKK